MEARASIPRTRRLLVVAGALSLLAAAGAPTATAALGVPESAESGLQTPALAAMPEDTAGPGLVTAVVTADEDLAAEMLTLSIEPGALDPAEQKGDARPPASSEALPQTAEPLAQSASSVLETARESSEPPVQAATETVAETTMPALESVDQAQLPPTQGETLTVLAEVIVTPVAEAAHVEPLPQATKPVLETKTPSLVYVDINLAAERASRDESSAVTASEELSIGATVPMQDHSSGLLTPASTDRETLARPSRRGGTVPPQDSGSIAFSSLSGVPGGQDDDTVIRLVDAKASPARPSAPAPFAPGGPLSGLASASAAAGAGALVLLLAALAAALLLTAPGPGRRLRPRLAPWRQSIIQLSLERPG